MKRIPRRLAATVLTLCATAFAPAPPPEGPKPERKSSLAEDRYRAASRQFEEVWTFYRQSRTDSFQTYFWSRLVLESQQDLARDKAERVAAFEAHRERMGKLESLVRRVRKLGFGFSTDVGATEYYRIEADRWLEKARAE
jgi:hypothetical protein